MGLPTSASRVESVAELVAEAADDFPPFTTRLGCAGHSAGMYTGMKRRVLVQAMTGLLVSILLRLMSVASPRRRGRRAQDSEATARSRAASGVHVEVLGPVPSGAMSRDELRAANAPYFRDLVQEVGADEAARALDRYLDGIEETTEANRRRGDAIQLVRVTGPLR